MAYQKLSPITLIKAIQNQVEAETGLRCYDHVPFNEKSPFYYAELTRTLPANTKTMYRDNYTVTIHCIAEKSPSSVGVYELIEKLGSALSEDIILPEPFEMVLQTDNGVSTIKEDESGEKHAVASFSFMVCYGFICKI